MKTANIPVYGIFASKLNILKTKILRMHVFSIFTIKTPETLATLTPL